MPQWEDSKKNGLESIAKCNFTVAGFVKIKDVPECERLGLAAIVEDSPLASVG